jgi:hypothetical protein
MIHVREQLIEGTLVTGTVSTCIEDGNPLTMSSARKRSNFFKKSVKIGFRPKIGFSRSLGRKLIC